MYQTSSYHSTAPKLILNLSKILKMEGKIQMNFDVNKAAAKAGMTKKTTETPLDKMIRDQNEKETGLRVEHMSHKSTGLKSAAERDVDDVVKEMPNTIKEISSFGNRIASAKARLGLGEGGFVDCEVDRINYTTGQVDERVWMTSQQINAEFIAAEAVMTDDELDAFLMKYFVEFNTKTGEIYPRKYPTDGRRFSVEFPKTMKPAPSNPVHTEPNVEHVVEQQPTIPVNNTDDTINDEEFAPIPMKKVKIKVEERTAGVRKKLSKNQISQISEMVLDRNSVTCVAVASRYKCDITGVTYEEFDQIRSMVETSNLAKETKMWSIVYRHVKNPTIGEFKNFQDFCEHTAWVDRRRFWFALMCTMTRDIEKIPIKCLAGVWKPVPQDVNYDITQFKEVYPEINDVSQLPTSIAEIEDLNVYTFINIGDELFKYIPTVSNPSSTVVKWIPVEQMVSCDTQYDHEYINRSLIDIDNIESWVKEESEKINSFTAMNEAIEYHNEGPLMSKRVIPINDTVSLDVGIKSVADILRNDYKYAITDELATTMKKVAKDEIKSIKGESYEPTDEEVIQYIREDLPESAAIPMFAMSIIDKLVVIFDGEEYESDSDEDIIDALKNCAPQDISILYGGDANNTLLYRYNTSYEPTFSYKDCKCPTCGTTVNVPIERIEDLVFTLSRSLMITTFDIADL